MMAGTVDIEKLHQNKCKACGASEWQRHADNCLVAIDDWDSKMVAWIFPKQAGTNSQRENLSENPE